MKHASKKPVIDILKQLISIIHGGNLCKLEKTIESQELG